MSAGGRGEPSSRRRAIVAAVVGAVGAALFVAGVGHAYVGAWRRAAAWFATVVGAGLVLVAAFADPRTVTLATLPPAVSAPVVALLATSVVDAYVVARRRAAEAGARCPHCGRPVDSDLDLDFCEWCTEPLDRDDEDADADADGAGNVGPTDARRAR